MKWVKILTFFILVLAIFLGILTRFYKLGEAPAGLYLDEAAQGYNAYSILKTGKDEFGKTWPVVFRSFTDFKTPVYIYLIAPLIPLFNLTSFTVRFPSFFFSILTIPFLYLLLGQITPKRLALSLSLLASLLLAISPWHILFGRTNFECNVALFFFLAGVYFFYKGIKDPKQLIFSLVLFALAIPSYHSQRIITPLMILLLFIRYKTVLLRKTHRKHLFLGIIVAALITLPTLSVALTPGFLARAAGLNIFSHQNRLPAGYLENYQGVFAGLVNNSFFLSTREFLALYTSYFSPRNMFILGDSGPRSSFPEIATFFLWQFPFYLYGLYLLIKEKNLKEVRFFTLTLLLISPIPAALTRDPYSTIRALPMVIPQLVIVSLGLIKTYESINLPFKKFVSFSLFGLLLIYSLAKLWSSAIILNEYFRAHEWNFGWKEVVTILDKQNKNLPVVVDDARDEPYIQLLFFLKFNPPTYQAENFEVAPAQYYTNMERVKTKKIGNMITRSINWEKDLWIDQYLVGDSLSISYDQIERHKLTLIDEVKFPNGEVAFRIVRTNSEYQRQIHQKVSNF